MILFAYRSATCLLKMQINYVKDGWGRFFVVLAQVTVEVSLVNKQVQFRCLKKIEDEEGRMLLILADVQGRTLILANTYAPNTDDLKFIHNLFLTLSSLSGSYITAGDFNCTLNPELDRSSGIDNSHSKSRQTIQHLMKELNLTDIWRDMNPKGLKYSCYSNTHKSILNF